MQHDFDFIAERNGNRYLPREREREPPPGRGGRGYYLPRGGLLLLLLQLMSGGLASPRLAQRYIINKP